MSRAGFIPAPAFINDDRLPVGDVEFSHPLEFFLPSPLCVRITELLRPYFGNEAQAKARAFIQQADDETKPMGLRDFYPALRRIIAAAVGEAVTIDTEYQVITPKQLPPAT